MNLWTGGITFPLLCLCLFLQKRQVNTFLKEHDAPPLPDRLSDCVSLVFLPLGMFLVSRENLPALFMFSALLPLLWLDCYRHWLPLRFTNIFWSTGLLTQLLADKPLLSVLPALVNSILMFGLMWSMWWGLKRHHQREVLGLGDVHLIAGLFAWLTPAGALYTCGLSFLLMFVAIVISRKPQPLAPFMCLSLLAGLFTVEFTQL
ncbi:hypothetical protein CBU34_20110 [Salmonella enterica subsp. enterica serovar Muenchen]|uniref:Prepilin type IV endopeptidase peptidase domain-containing protein n=1 Tax=Salmonella enterica TaxID=28901 RepID=A0A759YS69_SALER|nr:hypothetical protein [Salmonella enterica]EBV3242431.1 hypothetical protein [Salmonella enterica subsp. enterica serovar Oranienburg]ECF6946446.1 hypothetical protein [Salmonella enterica subsp. diarizonae]ECT3983537.1 hypothetical protein [Salmonella enterica subsp. houtenae serovar 53:z4,z23:-]ECT8843979.1 hypothetical protein [Salmonella enterica subsp. enterica serovar Muenchen]EFO9812103.1 hypothetical protein [Salmonella enterica subsp. enterica serovar Enteritidis]MCH5484401.1 prepi